MSSLSSFKRNLKEKNVWIAKEVLRKNIEIAQKYVENRVKTDVQFAKNVLEIAGDNLPAEIKKLAEETITRETANKTEVENQSLVSIDGVVPVQTDGGGEILVRETELPDYPKDK